MCGVGLHIVGNVIGVSSIHLIFDLGNEDYIRIIYTVNCTHIRKQYGVSNGHLRFSIGELGQYQIVLYHLYLKCVVCY